MSEEALSVRGWLDVSKQPVHAFVENLGRTPIRSITLTPTIQMFDSDGVPIGMLGGTPLRRNTVQEIGPGVTGMWELPHFGDLSSKRSVRTELIYEFEDVDRREWIGQDGLPSRRRSLIVLEELAGSATSNAVEFNDRLNDALRGIDAARSDRIRSELVDEGWIRADFDPSDGPPYSAFFARELTYSTASAGSPPSDGRPSIPGYRLEGDPKSGGQAQVWKATRQSNGEQVAIKIMTPSDSIEADMARFRREIGYQSELTTPGIMPILEKGLSADPPYYVMPWATTSLGDSFRSPMRAEDAAQTVIAILEALNEAHKRNVLHRDIKPENVLWLDGAWHISDFGLCRSLDSDSTTITMTGIVLGSWAYMPPEQLQDPHNATPASDIYSVGRVFYRLLTGEDPTPLVDLNLSTIDARYRHIINQCTRTKADERYQQVEEVLKQLREVSSTEHSTESQLEIVRSAVSAMNGGVGDSAQLLSQSLMQYSGDFELFRKGFMDLNELGLDTYLQVDPVGFSSALEVFDDHVSGSLGFSFTDEVADFLEIIFRRPRLTEEQREIVLRRILLMGFAHNRWHVGQVFARLISSRSDESHCYMTAQLLRANPDCAVWNADFVNLAALPLVIRAAFSDTEPQGVQS